MVRLASLPLLLLSASTLPFLASADSSPLPDASLPVHTLTETGDTLLAAGDKRGALDHFNVAIEKDPLNYITIFKRATVYLALNRPKQAHADFDAVLELKPDFKNALIQRARIKTKSGDWEAARKDYGRLEGNEWEEQLKELEEAEESEKVAKKASEKEEWEKCIEASGKAIQLASQNLDLRSLRAKCRTRNGDILEAVTDLQQVLNLDPSLTDPHLYISRLLFYLLDDYDRAATQLRKCLHSDPDSKPCSRLFRQIKNQHKSLSRARTLHEKRQFISANKLYLPDPSDPDEPGLLSEIETSTEELITSSPDLDPKTAPQQTLLSILESLCEAYLEMSKPSKATPYCTRIPALNPSSLPATLHKAHLLLSDSPESAYRLLEKYQSEHPDKTQSSKLFAKHFKEAQTAYKRSLQKDYYAVLGVSRDADDRTIKRAYRKMVKEYHPDKYRGDLTEEQIQAKMSQINEAWEVLSDEQKKEMFDNGVDPNAQEGQGGPGGNPFAHHGGNPFAGFDFGGGNPFGGQGGPQFMFRQQGGGGGGQRFKFGGF